VTREYSIAFSSLALSGKIPAGDPLWPKFTASFVNETSPTIDIANRIYSGNAFTTWHSNHWRHASNYIQGQHIGLDFDTEDERSSLDYLAKESFIAQYGSLIYTTPSHTQDNPRARVVFLLDTPIYQAQNYVMAATAMTWLYSAADAKCKDAARFFYGSHHCDVEYMDHVLPLDVVKGIISKYKATGQQTRRYTERNLTDTDAAHMVDKAIIQAGEGERNNYGYWLACRWAEAGISQTLAEEYILDYQRAVSEKGRSEYSEHEALLAVRSAYK